MVDMKIHECAQYVLEQNDSAMHQKDITKQIIDLDLYTFNTPTPAHVVGIAMYRRSAICTDERNKSEEEVFIRIASGTWDLAHRVDSDIRLDIESNITADEEIDYGLDSSLLLEEELHRWIYKQWKKDQLQGLDYGPLKLADEDEQQYKNGKYNCPGVGEIDFLAETQEGALIVIEFKRNAPDKTIGQLLRYIGWIQANLANDDQEVRGAIIAQRFDQKLNYAIDAIPSALTINKHVLEIEAKFI